MGKQGKERGTKVLLNIFSSKEEKSNKKLNDKSVFSKILGGGEKNPRSQLINISS